MGDTGPGGGIVFYDAGAKQLWGRYLEAAPTDYQVSNARTSVEWGCYYTLIGAIDTAIGTGKANTTAILSKCKTVGIAADVANKYSTSTAAAGQWFLPSRDELNELCKYALNQTTGNTAEICSNSGTLRTGFAASYYWNSSEGDARSGGYQFFAYGNRSNSSNYKGSAYYVRPVRAF